MRGLLKNALSRALLALAVCACVFVSSCGAAFSGDINEGDDEMVEVTPHRALAVGDVHVKLSYTAAIEKFRQTMEYVRDNGVKVFISNGDLVHFGDEANYKAVSAIIKEVFDGVEKNDMPEFIFNMGNHEFYPSDYCRYEESDYDYSFALFESFANEWMKKPINSDENIYVRNICGINYVAGWSSQKGRTGGESFTSKDFEKLKSTLDKATKGDAPFIFLTHSPWGYTYGNNADTPPYAVTREMNKLLKNYPSVINLTSHTHFSVLHERTFDQTDYTTIALGAQVDEFFVSENEFDENGNLIRYANVDFRYKNKLLGDENAASLYGKKHFGVLFDFGENEVQVSRVDLFSGEKYDHGEWTIPYGVKSDNKNQKFYYETGERAGAEMTFSQGAEFFVSATETGDGRSKLTLDFTDVDNYFAVEGYKIEIFSDEGLIKRAWWLSNYWADVGAKSNYSASIGGIDIKENYTVKLYPMDFFGHYGEPVVKTAVIEN